MQLKNINRWPIGHYKFYLKSHSYWMMTQREIVQLDTKKEVNDELNILKGVKMPPDSYIKRLENNILYNNERRKEMRRKIEYLVMDYANNDILLRDALEVMKNIENEIRTTW